MRTDGFYQGVCGGRIHFCRWQPVGPVRGVVQIVHGIAEYAARYEPFAAYLNAQGYLVVAEDHMGHGQSLAAPEELGCFQGSWLDAVEDTCHLLRRTRQEFPQVPYLLFGHSMGSFLTRSLLIAHPDCDADGVILCGTTWQNRAVLPAALALCRAECRRVGEHTPSRKLQNLVFGGYNRKVEHPRTEYDWISRDERVVDGYLADPLCGFTASAGLLREMLWGIAYMEKPENLEKMKKDLPVFLIAGGDDPVGAYGKGIRRTEAAFRKAGVEHVKTRIYPLCRHELLNECNRREVYKDVAAWLGQQHRRECV